MRYGSAAPAGPLTHAGSLLPRKEVGLDLFFPSQMQENLKVRGVHLEGGLNACTQGWAHGVGAHMGAWGCPCVRIKACVGRCMYVCAFACG